ncbi:MAG: redoxin domain-containing protein [Bacteroidales bacterium]|nr:redoxin domain-containing protein [Bacteroidales bacterium]
MKKVFLFSTILILGQTLLAQINLDAIWRQSVVDNYTKFNNYTAEIITNSTIRGKDTKDRGVIDTLYTTIDTALIYIENKKMAGVRSKNTISYTENDTNTTINFARKFISINSLQDYWGEYFNDVCIRWETHFYTSIIGYPSFFKKIDKISDIGDYFVFECMDSSMNINDIQMYEEVKMYVNKDNYLLERIITKRQNNTIAELELGAVTREIVINYLEFNQPHSIYKSIFNTDFYSDFSVIKNDNPYTASNKKRSDKREQQKSKFEKSKSSLNQKLLDCEIVDFENNSIKLNDIKGWILLDIWYKGCYPCFEMMKAVALNQREFEKRDITIVSLNTYEQPSDYLKAFCEKMKIDISTLYFFKNPDDVTIFQKQIKIFPSIFLISPDKKVVWQTTGKKSVTELLDELAVFL